MLKICIKVITLFALMATMACSYGGLKKQQYSCDPEFENYVQDFVYYAHRYGRNLDKMHNLQIYFADSLPIQNAIGVCGQSYAGRNIIILRSHWITASHYSKEQLIFHELGHCLLDKSHTTGYVEINGQMRPISIMNANHIPDKHYVLFRDDLIFGLFSQ